MTLRSSRRFGLLGSVHTNLNFRSKSQNPAGLPNITRNFASISNCLRIVGLKIEATITSIKNCPFLVHLSSKITLHCIMASSSQSGPNIEDETTALHKEMMALYRMTSEEAEKEKKYSKDSIYTLDKLKLMATQLELPKTKPKGDLIDMIRTKI